MTTVTKHGAKRLKERCGVPKRAVQRNAQTAYEKGLNYENATGKLKKYIDSKTKAHKLRMYAFGMVMSMCSSVKHY